MVQVLEPRISLSTSPPFSPELIRDIHEGPASSVEVGNFPGVVGSILTNGAVYFATDDGIHGIELWKTDGTPDGTVLVKDIFPGERFDGVPAGIRARLVTPVSVHPLR
jgi:ELWxxDGT repeat protein